MRFLVGRCGCAGWATDQRGKAAAAKNMQWLNVVGPMGCIRNAPTFASVANCLSANCWGTASHTRAENENTSMCRVKHCAKIEVTVESGRLAVSSMQSSYLPAHKGATSGVGEGLQPGTYNGGQFPPLGGRWWQLAAIGVPHCLNI